jgi:predicted ATP-dependent serine protease
MDTTDSELNRVLGGGIVPGHVILLGGNQEWKNLLLQISLKLLTKPYMFRVKKPKTNKNEGRKNHVY